MSFASLMFSNVVNVRFTLHISITTVSLSLFFRLHFFSSVALSPVAQSSDLQVF
jgi:hypothetical protein